MQMQWKAEQLRGGGDEMAKGLEVLLKKVEQEK